jgi:hypothetical protein
MHNCTGLTSIDLSSLSKLESFNDYFMSDCTGLTSIDLSPLSKLESIGNNFINNNFSIIIECTLIQSKKFKNLKNIKIKEIKNEK